MIEGTEVKLAGKVYTVPPLNLKGIKKVLPLLPKLRENVMADDGSAIEAVALIAHTALVRNYPELTVDAVEDLIDVGNMQELIAAVMGASGLVPKLVTGTAAGELSPGTSFTPGSPAQPDGAGSTSTTA